MGGESGNTTKYWSSPGVFSTAASSNFTSTWSDDFFNCHTSKYKCVKTSVKHNRSVVLLSLRAISWRRRAEFQICWDFFVYFLFAYTAMLRQGQCFQFSNPILQWFTRYDLRIICSFFGWPSSLFLLVLIACYDIGRQLSSTMLRGLPCISFSIGSSVTV